jgi:acetyl-CoA carboxylase carboxyl transferase subunit alpha
MEQSEKFGRPIITFIDTPGADPGVRAEERGQAQAIAANLTRMITLKVPVIATVIGEGGSGGALAIAVGDHVIMLENSIYSISTPETYATILWKDAGRAQEAAAVMKITAADLAELKVIDEVLPEPLGGAHKNPQEMAKALSKSIQKALNILNKQPVEPLLEKRYEKFRSIGHVISG